MTESNPRPDKPSRDREVRCPESEQTVPEQDVQEKDNVDILFRGGESNAEGLLRLNASARSMLNTFELLFAATPHNHSNQNHSNGKA